MELSYKPPALAVGSLTRTTLSRSAAKTALTAPTLHGTIHVIFAFVSITAIALGLFVLSRRFAREPGWRGWATYSVLSGILTIVLITVFGALNGQHSEIAGLFERLATSLGTLWGLVFLTRLWMGTGFGSFKHQISSPDPHGFSTLSTARRGLRNPSCVE